MIEMGVFENLKYNLDGRSGLEKARSNDYDSVSEPIKIGSADILIFECYSFAFVASLENYLKNHRNVKVKSISGWFNNSAYGAFINGYIVIVENKGE